MLLVKLVFICFVVFCVYKLSKDKSGNLLGERIAGGKTPSSLDAVTLLGCFFGGLGNIITLAHSV